MMQKKWMLTTFILFGMAALTSAAAHGQAGAPANEQSGNAAGERVAAASRKQTDIGISGYKTFTSATSGNGTQQTPSDSAGGMLELRHIVNPLLGYEITYSFNPANQAFAPKAGACALVCQNPPTKITAKASEIAIDYVASYKVGNLRPFVVGGLGFFVTFPGPTPFGNNTLSGLRMSMAAAWIGTSVPVLVSGCSTGATTTRLPTSPRSTLRPASLPKRRSRWQVCTTGSDPLRTRIPRPPPAQHAQAARLTSAIAVLQLV